MTIEEGKRAVGGLAQRHPAVAPGFDNSRLRRPSPLGPTFLIYHRIEKSYSGGLRSPLSQPDAMPVFIGSFGTNLLETRSHLAHSNERRS